MRVAFDTNVMAYAEGIDGAVRQHEAIALIEHIPRENVVLPVQTLGELFTVLIRKGQRSAPEARNAVLKWADGYPLADTSAMVIIAAIDLVADHKLSIWDSVILSASAAASCRLLLSEDMQDGFTWKGITVVNPFLTPPNPLLAAARGQRLSPT